MPKVDHRTRLQLIRYYREGMPIYSIKNRLQENGIELSWSNIKYYTNKYDRGDFDDQIIPFIPETTDYTFKKITQENIDTIKNTLSTDPLQSGKDVHNLLMSMGSTASYATIKTAITAAGFTSATPRYCQLIRDANKLKRVDFCNTLIDNNDTMDDIIFTDETSVQLHQNKTHCYRPTGALATMCPKPKHPLKIHVWAGISRRGPTEIFLFEGIMKAPFFVTEILQNTLLPFKNQMYPDHHRFQQDNDPKHTSKLAKTFMKENNINWWDTWPSESPDLNPIEMVWANMKKQVARERPTTKDALIDVLLKFWKTHMTNAACNRYIDHIYKVAPVCVLLGGRATGDIPNRLFTVDSENKSFQFFNNMLKTPEIQKRANLLLPIQ